MKTNHFCITYIKVYAFKMGGRGIASIAVVLLSLCYHFQFDNHLLSDWNEMFEGWAFFGLISVLDLCGSILVCKRYRSEILPKLVKESPRSWFEILCTCTVMQFGGTTLTGLLLGQTPSWILSRTAIPALLLAWWLTFFCPFDLFWKFLSHSNVFKEGFLIIVELGSCISYAHAITSWGMDKAIFPEKGFHNEAATLKISRSFFTCLLCGTLSSCGGGLLVDWLGWTGRRAGESLKIFQLYRDGYSGTATLNKSFWLALLYYCLLNVDNNVPWQLQLSPHQGHLAISCISIFTHLFQSTFPENDDSAKSGDFANNDLFQHLSTWVLRILNVSYYIGGEGESKGQTRIAAASQIKTPLRRSSRSKLSNEKEQ